MAYANFKPTIWSKYIQQTLEKKARLADFCNRKFEGEAKLGEQVKILNAPSPTVFDYNQETGLDTPETLEGTYTLLTLDQAKAFNFMLDDIDRLQSMDGVMESILVEKAHKMLEYREKYVGKLASAEEIKNIVPSAQITTAKAAKAAVDSALLMLRENDVPMDENVHIELSPFMYYLFRDYIIEIKTENKNVLDHGVVGMYDNAQVVMSNCLYNDGTDDYCMARTGKAIAFASGIDKLEAYRPEKFFADAVKGLNVYGGKVVRPNEIAVIKVHK